MSFGAISIGLGLLFLSTFIIVTPWRGRGRAAWTPALAPVSQPASSADLEGERDAAYAALADLDIDYQLGKVNAEDYQRTRAALLTQAVAALQKLDRAQTDLEREVEGLVRTRRTALATCSNCGGTLEPHGKFCAHCGAASPARCPRCHTQAAGDDRFCRGCGTALA